MLNIFQALPWLSPFNMLDTKAERERVTNLFTEAIYTKITEYWKCKAEIYSMTDEQAFLDSVPKSYDKRFMKEAQDLLNEVFFTLDFYNDLTEDMQKAFYALRKFVSYIDEADRFDEEHLLPIVLEVFGKVPFPVQTEYVGIKKSSRSKTATVARRMWHCLGIRGQPLSWFLPKPIYAKMLKQRFQKFKASRAVLMLSPYHQRTMILMR